MSGLADILIRSARLRNRSHLADIMISDGRILTVGPRGEIDARTVIDVEKNLVPPNARPAVALAATSLNLKECGLEVGHPAYPAVPDQPSVTEALRYHASPRAVISHGRMIDAERMRSLADAGRGT